MATMENILEVVNKLTEEVNLLKDKVAKLEKSGNNTPGKKNTKKDRQLLLKNS